MRDYEFIDRERKRLYGTFRCRLDPARTDLDGSPTLRLWALDFAAWRVRRIPGEVSLAAASAS
jgi:hypothetical protein